MKRKYIILIEIVIWLIIITTCVSLFIYNNVYKSSTNNGYYLFFDDAGGLVKGSPVRLMGMNIGYVRDVKIFDNKVFVSFQVTKKNIIVPNRASATIEFYGLGGSTSLELDPSSSVETNKREMLIPKGASRIQDYWNGSKLSNNVMIETYDSLRLSIDSSGILNHKDILKPSKELKKYSNMVTRINADQDVIIKKLSEFTPNYTNDEPKDTIENKPEEAND